MLCLTEPSVATIRKFLDAQRSLPFTYPHVGATAATPPGGYRVNHTRVLLGEGDQVFRDARAAIERWEHFRLGWVQPVPSGSQICVDEVVAIVAHAVGLWWLNACRIVYVVDEQQPVRRFGFGYGTLADHIGTGEERFLIEQDEQGRVWYDILAFSRPHGFLAHLGYPYMRVSQKWFARDSAAAMQRAVGSASR